MAEKLTSWCVCCVSVLAGLGCCGVADAQSAQGDNVPSSSQGGTELSEIVVTAQRRTESLQDVPLSVQVVSGEALRNNNLNSLDSLTEITPAVHVGDNTRSNDLYIRGIGSGFNSAFDQGVGAFIDDVYQGRSRFTNSTFLDIANVEILKGPQSTFFGNNAIAGALNIITNKPTETPEGWARLLYGSYNQYAAETAVSGPISNTLSGRLAISVTGDSGYLYNTNLGTHTPENRDYAGRLQIASHPTEGLDLLFRIEAVSANLVGSDQIQQVVYCPPPQPYMATSFCSQTIAQHLPTGTNNNLTAIPAGAGTPYDSATYSLTAHYLLAGNTLTSVTAYTDYHFAGSFAANQAQDNGPVLFGAYTQEAYGQFSQELRLTSATDLPLEYLAGAYFQTDQLTTDSAFNIAFVNPELDSLGPPLSSLTPLGEQTSYRQGEQSYAAFASATWKVTDRFSLSGGLRATQVDKNYLYDEFYGFAPSTYGNLDPYPPPSGGTLCTPTTPATGLQALAASLPFGLGAACRFSGSRSDHALLPSGKIQYQIQPDVMVYFSYARGFLAGGFNGSDISGNISNLPFAPEHVNAYELGVKSEWFDHSLRVNADVFLSNYTDLQVSVTSVTPGGASLSLVNNAGSSRSEGSELEIEWAVNQQFRVSSNVTYLKAYYISYPDAGLTTLGTFCHSPSDFGNPYCVAAYGGNGDPGSVQNLAGRPTSFAPSWSGDIVGTYKVELPNEYRLTLEASPFFTTGYFLTGSGTDDPFEYQGGYVRLDARLGLESPDKHWNVDLIGKNLTDRVILTYAGPVPTTVGSFQYGREMSRNIAIQGRYRF
jgi:iron complex outermembrane recepter protein